MMMCLKDVAAEIGRKYGEVYYQVMVMKRCDVRLCRVGRSWCCLPEDFETIKRHMETVIPTKVMSEATKQKISNSQRIRLAKKKALNENSHLI